MQSKEMTLQGTPLDERLIANVALVRFLPSVNGNMLAIVVLVVKALAAVRTDISPDMAASVCVQVQLAFVIRQTAGEISVGKRGRI